MAKNFSGSFVTALALMGMVAAVGKADAALIGLDSAVFDKGTVTATSAFRFANTEPDMSTDGQVREADAISVLTPTVTVPEPVSMVLFGLGLIGVGIVQQRRRAKP